MREQFKTKYGFLYQNLPGGKGFFIGNNTLIEHKPLVIYCSRRIPLSVFEQSNEVVAALIERNVVLAGGWQSPMEKRLLKNIRKFENANIICFLAKGIRYFRPFKLLEPLLEQNRLLVISPFETEPRVTRKLVEMRDQWMSEILQRILFLYIDPNGKLRSLYEELIVEHAASLFSVGHAASLSYVGHAVSLPNVRQAVSLPVEKKQIFLLNHPENRPFVNDSVILIDKYNLEEIINV